MGKVASFTGPRAEQAISYGYDDPLPTGWSGALTLSRNNTNGLLTGTILGSVNETYTFDS